MTKQPYLPAGMTEEQFQRAAEKLLQVPAFSKWGAEGIEALDSVQGVKQSPGRRPKNVTE